MENASKALIMAASVLIGIMILSLLHMKIKIILQFMMLLQLQIWQLRIINIMNLKKD